jgi:hypothetical protein
MIEAHSDSRTTLKCFNFNRLYFGFRKDKAMFFNNLSQNHPGRDVLKEPMPLILLDLCLRKGRNKSFIFNGLTTFRKSLFIPQLPGRDQI